MLKTIEKQILEFAKDTGLTERREIVHGTLYVKLHEEKECDHFHKVIRTFYIDNINPEGGVNMFAVGDEFAFDFVPADREAPVFADEEEQGIWSEFAEEGLAGDFGLDPDNFTDEQLSDIDIQMQLEAESKRGK
tara:strand:- start:389 stop:790 length:402 start_codon:yes stop_codon:yes gene_type:complete